MCEGSTLSRCLPPCWETHDPVARLLALPRVAGGPMRAVLPDPGFCNRLDGDRSLQQQARFDDFVREFNTERPHEALAMKTPAQMYPPSQRPYGGLPDVSYPLYDREVVVTACGRICMYRKRINLSYVLAGRRVGIKEVDEGIWIVSFMHYDLGYVDLEQKTLQPLDNPFGPRLLPMS